MSLRAQRKQATRARVLEAARAQFEAHGFEGTHLRDVAGLAKVSVGTVLLHFADKRELLHAALFDDLERAWHAARDAPPRGSLAHELEALAGAFFGYYAQRPTLSRSLLRESLFAEPPWRERFAGQVAEVHALVARRSAEAKARGELVSTAEPALLGLAFLSFYYFALLAWLQGGEADPARLFSLSLRAHLAALAPARSPLGAPVPLPTRLRSSAPTNRNRKAPP